MQHSLASEMPNLASARPLLPGHLATHSKLSSPVKASFGKSQVQYPDCSIPFQIGDDASGLSNTAAESSESQWEFQLGRYLLRVRKARHRQLHRPITATILGGPGEPPVAFSVNSALSCTSHCCSLPQKCCVSPSARPLTYFSAAMNGLLLISFDNVYENPLYSNECSKLPVL